MKHTPIGVSFHTSDTDLQRLYDAAEASLLGNIVQFTPTPRWKFPTLHDGGDEENADSNPAKHGKNVQKFAAKPLKD